MRTPLFPAPIMILFLLACTGNTGPSATASDSGDSDATGDTAPPASTSSGTWYGPLEVLTSAGDGVCAGDGYVTVEDEGTLSGWSSCVLVEGPGIATWGVLYDGVVGADGTTR